MSPEDFLEHDLIGETFALADQASDTDLILAMLETGDVLMEAAGQDLVLANHVSASKAATMAGLIRWAPQDLLRRVFNDRYGDQPPLTVIQGGLSGRPTED